MNELIINDSIKIASDILNLPKNIRVQAKVARLPLHFSRGQDVPDFTSFHLGYLHLKKSTSTSRLGFVPQPSLFKTMSITWWLWVTQSIDFYSLVVYKSWVSFLNPAYSSCWATFIGLRSLIINVTW